MGSTQSTHKNSKPSKDKVTGEKPALTRLYSVNLEASFMLIGNRKVDYLQYDPAQTYMVAYGMDKQTDPRFSKKTLSSVTVLDAHQITMALIDKKVLPKDHVQLFAASKDLDMCTAQGIKESFQAAAKRTGKNGILFFHFSGHGIKVGNRWGLAPADFDYTHSTFLTGDVLNSWLDEVDCCSSHVIISLDCCYAGGLGTELTSSALNIRSGTYVLSACTAFETSLVIGPLGHSVYAYFLSYAIRVKPFKPGEFPVHKIFEECSTLCTAVTSFLVCYSSDDGLKIKAMQPVLNYFDISSHPSDFLLQSIKSASFSFDERDLTQSVDRYSFVTQYFNRVRSQGDELCELCLDWLGSMTEDGSHLKEIAKRRLLSDEILDTIVCLTMWSLASIQLVNDKDNAHKASQFLLAFLYTASSLDTLYQVRLTHKHLEQGLDFYLSIMEENNVNVDELYELKELTSNQDNDIPYGDTCAGVVDPVVTESMQAIQFTKKLYATCPVDRPKEDVCKLSVTRNWWVPISEEAT